MNYTINIDGLVPIKLKHYALNCLTPFKNKAAIKAALSNNLE
ncbi:hypothetical protein [Acinetobacter vivianii]|nr:hypothetical protein [Acinetobacter vivianii]